MNSDDVEVRTEQTAAEQAGRSQALDNQAGRAYRGLGPAASMFAVLQLRWIALSGGMAAFGASALSLALLGLGVPFLLAAALAGAWAGLLLYTLGRWALARASR